jgi:hypothetical protein
MSTRAIVAAKLSDGRFGAIYVHYDGYGLLPILREQYNSQEKVDALILSGDQRSLGEPYGDASSSTTFMLSFVEVNYLDWGQEYLYKWAGSGWKKSKVKPRSFEYKDAFDGIDVDALANEYFEFVNKVAVEHGKTYADLADEDKYEWACEFLCRKDYGIWDSSTGDYSGLVKPLASRMLDLLEDKED